MGPFTGLSVLAWLLLVGFAVYQWLLNTHAGHRLLIAVLRWALDGWDAPDAELSEAERENRARARWALAVLERIERDS